MYVFCVTNQDGGEVEIIGKTTREMFDRKKRLVTIKSKEGREKELYEMDPKHLDVLKDEYRNTFIHYG